MLVLETVKAETTALTVQAKEDAMSEDEGEKGEVENEDTAAVETSTEAARAAVAGEEATVGEKVEEAAVEVEEEEEATTEKVALPELTDEQRTALAEDPAIQELVRTKGAPDLNAFIKATLEEQEQTKEREQTQAAERKTLDEAVKAYEEDNDPAPLARIAAEGFKQAREDVGISAKLDEAVQNELRPYVEAVYGDTVRAMKPEEVKALGGMPLVDALKELDGRRTAAIRGESAEEVDDAKKATQNATAGVTARGDGGGVLPGGSAEEEVGDDIGTLMRQGMDEGIDAEEAVGG